MGGSGSKRKWFRRRATQPPVPTDPTAVRREHEKRELGYTVRKLAAMSDEELRQSASDALEPLIRSLPDGDYDIRNAAVTTLGRLQDPAAIEHVVAVMGTSGGGPSDGVAVEAVRSLGASTEQLCTLLRDGTTEQKHGSINLLLHFKDQDALPSLAAALKDDDPNVRGHTAYMLGHFGAHEAIRPLIESLGDGVSHVRERAVEALGILASGASVKIAPGSGWTTIVHSEDAPKRSEVIEPLSRLLDDPDESVRNKVVQAINVIGGAGALEQLAAVGASSRTPSSGIRGGLGEPYCSQKCFDLGGATIARHQIQGWTGGCSVCRGPLQIGSGGSGSMVCYKPGLFLYFHQDRSCVDTVRGELARATGCVVCGGPVS